MTIYIYTVGTLVLITAIMGLGLNFQWAHAGLLNFGQVGFFAIGAYSYALLTIHGMQRMVGILAAVVLAGVAGALIARLTVRLEGDYLAICMLAIAEVVAIVANNTNAFGGPSGIVGIAPIVSGRRTLLLLLIGVILLLIITLGLLTRSPFGISLQAVRDDRLAAQSLGKSIVSYKWRAFAIGAALAGLAGAFYASYLSYISPDQFDATVTFYALTGIILGGSSHWGALSGIVIFSTAQQGATYLPISSADSAVLQLFMVGVALIILVRFMPNGVFPYRRRPSAHVRKLLSARRELSGGTRVASTASDGSGPTPAAVGAPRRRDDHV